jgi:hypothetical protein
MRIDARVYVHPITRDVNASFGRMETWYEVVEDSLKNVHAVQNGRILAEPMGFEPTTFPVHRDALNNRSMYRRSF